eukprot:671264-Rhodomonas_salina.3
MSGPGIAQQAHRLKPRRQARASHRTCEPPSALSGPGILAVRYSTHLLLDLLLLRLLCRLQHRGDLQARDVQTDVVRFEDEARAKTERD